MRSTRPPPTLAALVIIALSAPAGRGQLRFDPVFADHMVLQADAPVPIWGTAPAGQDVTVTLGLETATVEADSDGRWRVVLSAQAASRTPFDITISGRGKRTVKNVVFGEVWLCLGEANVALPLSRSYGGVNEAPRADYPDLRFLSLVGDPLPEDRVFSDEELGRLTRDRYLSGRWTVCSPEIAPATSALAFHFGDALRRALEVPVGLIVCGVPHAPLESWIPVDPQEKRRRLGTCWLDDEKLSPALRAIASRNFEKVAPKDDFARRAWSPGHPFEPGFLAAALFGASPTPALRGVLWFHGESAAHDPAAYEALFARFVRSLEARWPGNRPTMVIVQLPGFGGATDPAARRWPEVREVQRRLAQASDTYLVVTIDQGDPTRPASIHKKAQAERAARCALARIYGREGPASGPLIRDAALRDGAVVLSFDEVGGGLAARGALEGFEIAGADGVFKPAKTQIDGDTVRLAVPAGVTPRRVRYAWEPFPRPTLFNREGLAASPFEIVVAE